MKRIALLGDERRHPSHRELRALVPQLADQFGVGADWVPTSSDFSVGEFDGVWLVPGSPYANDDAVLAALTEVRQRGLPFLGTCAGMQYAVIEYLRGVLGRRASHAETAGVGDDNAVSALSCSLYGVAATVTPLPGTRFHTWEPEPFVGMHYCNYAPNDASVAVLQGAGVVVGAVGQDGVAEVLEFPVGDFFVTSLYQPHIGALAGEPVQPLVRAFMEAVTAS